MYNEQEKKILEVSVHLVNQLIAKTISNDFMENLNGEWGEDIPSVPYLTEQIKKSYHTFSEFQDGASLHKLLSSTSMLYVLIMMDENCESLADFINTHRYAIEEEEIEE